jgi:hypothetical protein
MQKLAGIAFIVGSLLNLFAAFSPIFNRYFLEPDVQERIEIIEADPTGWAFNSGLFVAGIAVAGVGFLLLAWHIRRSQIASTRLISYFAAAAGGIGAVLALNGYFAGLDKTPQEIATAPVEWTAYAFIVLTQLALLATGVVLLRAGYPRWFGWTVLILTALTVIILVLVRAFPPLLFYLITLFIGIVLLLIPTADRDSGRMETTTPG